MPLLGSASKKMCLSLRRRITPLFVPWIVVNLVAVLAFLSLSLGTAIVHLVRV